jgi:hypothetical protein
MEALAQLGQAMVLHAALVGAAALVVWLLVVRRKVRTLCGAVEVHCAASVGGWSAASRLAISAAGVCHWEK